MEVNSTGSLDLTYHSKLIFVGWKELGSITIVIIPNRAQPKIYENQLFPTQYAQNEII